MTRPLRTHFPGATYHVICRGVNRCPIYTSDQDRQTFLRHMRSAFDEHGVRLFAYCLMGNHFHLLTGVEETPLGSGMGVLLTRYALFFNKAHDRSGHLFEDRHKAILCRNDAYLIQLTAYIHRNPVRAGLAKNPQDWPWSSHREFVSGDGEILDLDRLEKLTGMDAAGLRRAYLERVADAAEPLKSGLEALIESVARNLGLDSAKLRAGARDTGYPAARRRIAIQGQTLGYSLSRIAQALGCSRATLSEAIRRT